VVFFPSPHRKRGGEGEGGTTRPLCSGKGGRRVNWRRKKGGGQYGVFSLPRNGGERKGEGRGGPGSCVPPGERGELQDCEKEEGKMFCSIAVMPEKEKKEKTGNLIAISPP